MVSALVAAYAAMIVAACVQPLVLLAILPILALHAVIRWEGPETQEEASMRRAGAVSWEP